MVTPSKRYTEAEIRNSNRSPNAVKAPQPVEWRKYRVPQPMHDQMERCRLARSVGKSWKVEGDR